MNNGAPQFPDPNEPKLFKADILRVTGWSARKLDGLMGGRKGKAKLLYWRDGTGSRAPRFTQQWCLDRFYQVRSAECGVRSEWQAEVRLPSAESRIAKLEREVQEIKLQIARVSTTDWASQACHNSLSPQGTNASRSVITDGTDRRKAA